MFARYKINLLSLCLTSAFASYSVMAAPIPHQHDDEKLPAHSHGKLTQPDAPHLRQLTPPNEQQSHFNLPDISRQGFAAVDCPDVDKIANYSGTALADYLVSLPDYECTYGLFSANSSQQAKIYTLENYLAVVNRLAAEAANYNATTSAVDNLVLFLRAGYFLADSNPPSTQVRDAIRPALRQLMTGSNLFKPNPVARSTAREVMTLVTNMRDEAYFLPYVRDLVVRFTNSSNNPNASDVFKSYDGDAGFTGILTIFYYAQWRDDAKAVLVSDLSYLNALNGILTQNKSALLDAKKAYQLNDTANEAFRFMQYPQTRNQAKTYVKQTLASSSMMGVDSDLWIAAARAVDYYDSANCAEYGTCGYRTKIEDLVLKNRYTCSPSIKIKAQDMTEDQFKQACSLLAQEEDYFHAMLQTNRKPVANDNNTTLEVVVFDDYTNYDKWAGTLFDISTDNGGMYLEGDPAKVGNQARFIAHEASWLRPKFSIWNLEHEFVHYLDGRFNMYGDFSKSTTVPTVWWIEGIAEYLSLKNNNQKAIDVAKKGTYKLSQIFQNTYGMSDYVPRAYSWGYMAARFMVEKHRGDVNAVMANFRSGDYQSYQKYMSDIGSRYDSEFASWVSTATTSGTPPLPDDVKWCESQFELKKGCAIKVSADNVGYLALFVPSGARNLVFTSKGGNGDMDMYVGRGYYPTNMRFDGRSIEDGNVEKVTIYLPAGNTWYYLTLPAKSPYAEVSVTATYVQ